jgi:hypothetical protein
MSDGEAIVLANGALGLLKKHEFEVYEYNENPGEVADYFDTTALLKGVGLNGDDVRIGVMGFNHHTEGQDLSLDIDLSVMGLSRSIKYQKYVVTEKNKGIAPFDSVIQIWQMLKDKYHQENNLLTLEGDVQRASAVLSKEKSVEHIIELIAGKFPTFGGGKEVEDGNPIAKAMQDRPVVFAAGVRVDEVVGFIISQL